MTEEQSQKPFYEQRPKREYSNFWVWLAERIGIPMFILGVITYGGWQIAGWMAPRLDKIATKHVEFVDTADALQKQNSVLLERSVELQEANAEIQAKIVDSETNSDKVSVEHFMLTREIGQDLKEVGKDLKEVHKAVVKP